MLFSSKLKVHDTFLAKPQVRIKKAKFNTETQDG